MEKGINLAIKDFKMDLVSVINKSKIPPTVVSYVLQDLLNEVGAIVNNAIKVETEEYEKSQKGEDE